MSRKDPLHGSQMHRTYGILGMRKVRSTGGAILHPHAVVLGPIPIGYRMVWAEPQRLQLWCLCSYVALVIGTGWTLRPAALRRGDAPGPAWGGLTPSSGRRNRRPPGHMRGFLNACGTFAGALVEDPTNDYRRNLLMLTMGPICGTMLSVNVTFVSVVVRGDHDPPPPHRYPEGGALPSATPAAFPHNAWTTPRHNCTHTI